MLWLLQRRSARMLRLFQRSSPGMLRLLRRSSSRMLRLLTLHSRLCSASNSIGYCRRAAFDNTFDDAPTKHGEGTLRHGLANRRCDDRPNCLMCIGIRVLRSFRVLQKAGYQRAFLSSVSSSSMMPGKARSASEMARPQVGIAGHARLYF